MHWIGVRGAHTGRLFLPVVPTWKRQTNGRAWNTRRLGKATRRTDVRLLLTIRESTPTLVLFGFGARDSSSVQIRPSIFNRGTVTNTFILVDVHEDHRRCTTLASYQSSYTDLNVGQSPRCMHAGLMLLIRGAWEQHCLDSNDTNLSAMMRWGG